jgi:hypothetical protein
MAKSFDELLKEKSSAELAEMKRQLSSFVPYKQRMILTETETREELDRRDAAIRSEARAVTLQTLEEWFRETFDAEPVNDGAKASNEEIIAGALGTLIDKGRLSIPKGGYLVTHGKTGVKVKAAAKKTKKKS